MRDRVRFKVDIFATARTVPCRTLSHITTTRTVPCRSAGLAKGVFLLNSFAALLGSVAVTMHVGIWYYYFPIAAVAILVAWSSVEAAKMNRRKQKEYA